MDRYFVTTVPLITHGAQDDIVDDSGNPFKSFVCQYVSECRGVGIHTTSGSKPVKNARKEVFVVHSGFMWMQGRHSQQRSYCIHSGDYLYLFLPPLKNNNETNRPLFIHSFDVNCFNHQKQRKSILVLVTLPHSLLNPFVVVIIIVKILVLSLCAFLLPLLSIVARVMRFTLVLLLPVVVSSALRGNGKPTLSDTGDLEGNLLPPRFRFPVPCPGPYDITDTRLIIECQGDPNTFVLESVQGFYCCPWSKPSPSTQTQTQTKEQQPVRQWNPVKNDIRGQGLDDRLGYGLDNGNGMALSGDGTTIAAASRYNDGTYHDGGQVRIWQDTPFGWEPVGQELQGDHGGSHFGWSVDINHDGTVVAIGSIRHIGQKGNYQGMLRVYSLVDGFPMGKWQPLGEVRWKSVKPNKVCKGCLPRSSNTAVHPTQPKGLGG